MTTDTTPDTPTVLDAADALALQAGKGQAFDAVTLRDYFAASALQGLIAAHTGELSLPKRNEAARWAFEFADQMLIARRPSA